MLSAFTWATIMKTKCMHTSDKYQEINKNKVSKPNERLFIIRLVMSLAPSAPSFPLISPSYRRQSNHVAAVWRAAFTGLQRSFTVFNTNSDRGKFTEETSIVFTCKTGSDFANLLMICDPFVDSEIVKSCTHNFSLNLHYSHHNRASHSISKC